MSSRLSGKTVLITRSEEQSEPLSRELKALGARVLSVPTIRFALSDDLREWSRAMEKRQAITHLVFTSQNAARFFLELTDRERIPLSFWRERRIAAVGKRTESFLSEAGLGPHFTPRRQRGIELAAELIETGELGPGSVVLLPHSDIAPPDAADYMNEAGAAVFSPAIYETRTESPEKAALLFDELDRGGTVDAVTFASPSAVRGFLEMTGTRGRNLLRSPGTYIVSIGPSTSRAILEENFDVAREAAEPSMKALAEAVKLAVVEN